MCIMLCYKCMLVLGIITHWSLCLLQCVSSGDRHHCSGPGVLEGGVFLSAPITFESIVTYCLTSSGKIIGPCPVSAGHVWLASQKTQHHLGRTSLDQHTFMYLQCGILSWVQRPYQFSHHYKVHLNSYLRASQPQHVTQPPLPGT